MVNQCGKLKKKMKGVNICFFPTISVKFVQIKISDFEFCLSPESLLC